MYVKQLQARRPDLYETIVRFEVQPGTREALLQHGARGPGQLLEQQGLGGLPLIRRGQLDVVHVKAEGEAINYGLRSGSARHFNERILGFEEIR